MTSREIAETFQDLIWHQLQTMLDSDANDFTIDISILGTTPNAAGAGGGAAVSYTCDLLVVGSPYWWGIWDENIHFDQAFSQQTLCRLNYYKLPVRSYAPPRDRLRGERHGHPNYKRMRVDPACFLVRGWLHLCSMLTRRSILRLRSNWWLPLVGNQLI